MKRWSIEFRDYPLFIVRHEKTSYRQNLLRINLRDSLASKAPSLCVYTSVARNELFAFRNEYLILTSVASGLCHRVVFVTR